MRSKLNWVDVLNEQTRWYERADLKQWFADLVGRPTNLSDGTIEGFEEALVYMRRQIANRHFDEPIDLVWLDTQLKTLTLGLLHHQGAQVGENSKLPSFRARIKGMQDADLLRAFKETLLVQFAEYIGETLDSKSHGMVGRCEGLQPTSVLQPIAEIAKHAPELEEQWRSELMATVPEAEAAEISRCATLVIVTGGQKSRFCSDACRFATVQIIKQSPEPELLAVKQRRYHRQSKA